VKAIVLKFKTTQDQRLILGACWANGLDVNEEDEDAIAAYILDLCKAELDRKFPKKPDPPTKPAA